MKFSSKVSVKLQARIFIFGMQVDKNVLYLGIANQPSPAYSFLYLSIFFSLYIFRQRYLHNCIGQKLQIWYLVDKLYCGIENRPPPICSSLYLFIFLSLQIFRQRYLHNRLR